MSLLLWVNVFPGSASYDATDSHGRDAISPCQVGARLARSAGSPDFNNLVIGKLGERDPPPHRLCAVPFHVCLILSGCRPPKILKTIVVLDAIPVRRLISAWRRRTDKGFKHQSRHLMGTRRCVSIQGYAKIAVFVALQLERARQLPSAGDPLDVRAHSPYPAISRDTVGREAGDRTNCWCHYAT